MNFHFLFEQSGTFKNAFKEFGHNCYDYDILNDFGQTDYVIDLFNQIEISFSALKENKPDNSIFGNMYNRKDFIMAFFPCTYFCDHNSLIFKRYLKPGSRDSIQKATDYLLEHTNNRAKFLSLYIKLVYIVDCKGLPIIIENPASGFSTNYLLKYSPIDVGYYEKDRSLFGDLMKKPTNFFAHNFEMKEKFIMFTQTDKLKKIRQLRGCKERSMISSEYARNFYLRFIDGRI